MAANDPKTAAQAAKTGASPQGTFPDPSITLVEFGDALGLLLAARTEREPGKRRLILKKVAYLHLRAKSWGYTIYPEVWVEQMDGGVYRAIDAKSKKVFPNPSKRRYEVAFLKKEIFDCAIQCMKSRQVDAIYELIVVTFGKREGFEVEQGALLAPEDYATVTSLDSGEEWVPKPEAIKA